MRVLSLLVAAVILAACAPDPSPSAPPQGSLSASEPSMTAPSPAASPSDPAEPSRTPTVGPVAVLDVECGPAAPVLGSDTVRTSPDGIHLRVTGEPGWDVGIGHELGRESVLLERANQELVLRIAPGEVTVDCGDPTLPNLPPTSALRIEDPDGWYRSTAIGAGAGSCVSASVDYAQGAKGEIGDPVLLARAALRGLRAGDVVERGGYPADTGLVRVVRAGEVIGALTFDGDGRGGWFLAGSTLCGGLGTG